MQRGPAPRESVTCSQCGRPFVPREPHHRQCSDCFRAGRDVGAAARGGAFGGQRPGGEARRAPAGGPVPTAAGAPRGGGAATLPAGYLNGGYFDADGHLRLELVTDAAMEIVEALGQERMANGQLRRFFAKVRVIQGRLDAGTPFAALRAEIAALQRDAASAVARGVAPEVFKAFVDANVPRALADERAFVKGFVEHFHSVVAYYRYRFPRS